MTRPAPAPQWLRGLPAALAAEPPEFFRQFEPPPGITRHAAVLILFGLGDNGIDVVLTERGADLRSHARQVSFPGGRVDPNDAGPVAAALREAHEEVGIEADGVEILGAIAPLHLAPSGNAVTPVLGWWHTPTPLAVVSALEVESVVRAPIIELVDPANRFMVRTPSGFLSPGFEVSGLFVWGFTAKVLEVILDVAGLAGPWDQALMRDLPEGQLGTYIRGGPAG